MVYRPIEPLVGSSSLPIFIEDPISMRTRSISSITHINAPPQPAPSLQIPITSRVKRIFRRSSNQLSTDPFRLRSRVTIIRPERKGQNNEARMLPTSKGTVEFRHTLQRPDMSTERHTPLGDQRVMEARNALNRIQQLTAQLEAELQGLNQLEGLSTGLPTNLTGQISRPLESLIDFSTPSGVGREPSNDTVHTSPPPSYNE